MKNHDYHDGSYDGSSSGQDYFLIGINRFKVSQTYQHLRQLGWNLTSG